MSNDDPYSRHYWRWADEYPALYENDATCALFTRLVRLGDMAWPSAATLPFGVKRAALNLLINSEPDPTEPGLVLMITSSTFRIRGMDKERGKRSQSAKDAAEKRWRSAEREAAAIAAGNAFSNAIGNAERNAERNAETMPSRAEERRAKKSRGEERPAPADAMTETVDYIEERTGRPWSYRPGSNAWETLTCDLRDFGAPRVIEAMGEVDEEHPDVAQLVFGASRLLHPFVNAKPLTAAERERAETQRMVDAALAAGGNR